MNLHNVAVLWVAFLFFVDIIVICCNPWFESTALNFLIGFLTTTVMILATLLVGEVI